MTNFNESLDEILERLYNSGWVEGNNYNEDEDDGKGDFRSPKEMKRTEQAKQAIKQLVADEMIEMLNRIEQTLNDGKQSHSMAVISKVLDEERTKEDKLRDAERNISK